MDLPRVGKGREARRGSSGRRAVKGARVAEGKREAAAARVTLADIRQALPPTSRQLEVLGSYIVQGSHQGAGNSLGISSRTVQAHLASLRSRLGAHNEAQVVYLLWVEYRDHVISCSLSHHSTCELGIARVDRATNGRTTEREAAATAERSARQAGRRRVRGHAIHATGRPYSEQTPPRLSPR